MNTDTIATTASNLTSCVTEILPPLEVLRRCEAVAKDRADIREVRIGRTESGKCLKAYECGQGNTHVLMYGFPDPGEAVGGTTILALLNGYAGGHDSLFSYDVTWHFIPCLNLDDQPNGGRTLAKVFRDPGVREVDWCVANPRAETSALLDYAERIAPSFIFPLHDEYHCGEAIPCYAILSECVPPVVAERVRACLRKFGLQLQENEPHQTMGTAFALASELAGEEYLNSTFSHMSQYGMVAICEVSQQGSIMPSSLVAAQIAVGMCFVEAILEAKQGNIEQVAAADADKPRC